jgi:hypothetical protein
MEVQEIELVIDNDGQVHLRVCGVKGNACAGVTAPLEAALGGQVASRQLTAEFYDAAEQQTPLRQAQSGGS